MDHHALVSAADIARLAGVGRAAVSNWRRRYDDFPRPAGGSESSPSFRLVEVATWLREQGRLGTHSLIELAWQAIEGETGSGSPAEVLAVVGDYLRGAGAPPSADVHAAVDDVAAAIGPAETFERLCSRFVEAMSRHLVATPPELASLMVELAEIGDGPVLDPACGTGTLLRAVPTTVPVLGQELDPAVAELARARLAFTHEQAQIVTGDSLRADRFSDRRVASVVCNPPFNERSWGHEELQFDSRWVYGLPPKGESELAWVQHCLAHLRPGGRVVIVLPPGVASRRSGRSIRATLLRRGVLRAVISLPPGAVAPPHLPMQLWVLAVDDGQPADRAWLVDTTGGAQVRLEDLGWAEVRRRATTAEDPAVRRLVPTIDLLDEDVDLTPARYLRSSADVDDLVADRERFTELVVRLTQLLPDLAKMSDRPERPRTTIGELVRRGALSLHQLRGPMGLVTGPGRPVLTGADVAAGRGPSGSVADDVDGVRLQPGDVVVPIITSHPAAAVIEHDDGVLLGPGLQLLRPDPAQIDPWFLAGVLRSDETLRAASTKSGSYRVDVRRVELPRLPLEEQRRQGEVFARLLRFDVVIDDVRTVGRRLTQGLIDAVVHGQLEPGGTDR